MIDSPALSLVRIAAAEDVVEDSAVVVEALDDTSQGLEALAAVFVEVVAWAPKLDLDLALRSRSLQLDLQKVRP